MKIFRVETAYTASQKQFVVAENYEMAEKTFLKKYPHTDIREIVKIGDYVIIQEQS